MKYEQIIEAWVKSHVERAFEDSKKGFDEGIESQEYVNKAWAEFCDETEQTCDLVKDIEETERDMEQCSYRLDNSGNPTGVYAQLLDWKQEREEILDWWKDEFSNQYGALIDRFDEVLYDYMVES